MSAQHTVSRTCTHVVCNIIMHVQNYAQTHDACIDNAAASQRAQSTNHQIPIYDIPFHSLLRNPAFAGSTAHGYEESQLRLVAITPSARWQ